MKRLSPRIAGLRFGTTLALLTIGAQEAGLSSGNGTDLGPGADANRCCLARGANTPMSDDEQAAAWVIFTELYDSLQGCEVLELEDSDL